MTLRSPHHVPFNSVSVLPRGDERDPISHLAEVAQHVPADLELGLVVRRVAVCGPLDETELRAVCGVGTVNIDGEDDWCSD